jgi:hypothetical protein
MSNKSGATKQPKIGNNATLRDATIHHFGATIHHFGATIK